MNQLDRSLHGMELVTVDELEGLIASMKISNVVSMTMNDIASNLASLRMERSRNAEKSTKILDSTSSADFLTAENLKYDATSSTYNSNVGPYGNELQNRHKSMNLSNGTEPVILDDLRRSRSGDNREAKFSEEHGSSSDILRNFNDVNEKDLMIKSYCDTVPAPSEDSPVGQKRVSGLSKFVNPRRASFTKLGLLSKTTPSQSNLDYSGPQLSNDDMPSSPSALNTRKESPESPDYMIDTVDVNWLLGTDEPKVEADSFPDSATARESLPFKYTGTAAYNTVKGPLSTGHSDLLPGDNEAPLSSALDDFSSDSKGTDGAYSEEQKSKAFCDSDQSNRTYSVQSDSTEPGERVPRGKLPFGADAVRNHDDASSSWWGSNGDAREASNNVGEYSNTNSSMVSRTNSYMKRESNDNSSNTSTVDNNTVNRTSIFANASTPDIPANNGKVNQSQDAFVKPTIARMDSLGRSLKRTSITIDTSLISTVGDLESDDDDSSICTIGSDRFFSASQKKASPEVEVALQGKATNIPARVGDMNTVMGDKAQENSVCSSFNAEKRSNFEQPSNDVSYLEGDSCFDSSFENTMKNTDRALMRESNSDTDVTFTDYGSPKGRENGTRSPRSPASPSSPTTPSSSSFISASSPPYTPTPSVHGRTMNSSYNKLSTQQASSSAHRPQGGGVGPQGEGVVPSPLRVQSSANASTAPAQARTDGTYTHLKVV